MKRSRRWLLIFTAVVVLMAHAGALRPPSLQFNRVATKPPTTVSTTESSPSSSTTEASVEEAQSAEESASSANETTKSTLTGIPQIDYIWDPNLPRELNGYNLSDYPFLATVPEKEIDFKCDGLHDGFYASIKYKCQIYHHCIYGIRHDFLCANFTAFDQRTFICHFVSEVDCKNSDKYFFRNDALYKATTTTTTSTTTSTTVAPPPQASSGKRPFRRPFRRRRPIDYYYDEEYDDDYYEERVNRRQKNRPRPRRPEYDEDYEDDIYEKRPYNRERHRGGNKDDRRPVERPAEKPVDRPVERPVERPLDRPAGRPSERPSDHSVERPVDRPLDRPKHRKRPVDSRRYNDDEDRFPTPRKPAKRRRPIDIDDYEDEDKAPATGGGRRFNTNDRRPHHPKSTEENTKYLDEEEDRRPLGGRRRKGGRRPIVDDEDDVLVDRPLRREPPPEEPAYNNRNKDKEENIPLVRPTGSGSLFDRPRVPPRIAPPVPLNERKKFEYSTTKKTTTAAPRYEDDYYDDYEDVKPAKKTHKDDKYAYSNRDRIRDSDRDRDRNRDFEDPIDLEDLPAVKEDPKTRYETVGGSPARSSDYEDVPVKSSRYRQTSERGSYRPPSGRDHGFREVEIHKLESQTTTTTTTVAPKFSQNLSYEDLLEPDRDLHSKRPESRDNVYRPETRENTNNREISRPIVRVIKRPFLPSRGGSPYLPRGLQPVGAAQKPLPTESTPIDMGSTVSAVRLLEHGPPILRKNNDPDDYPPPRKGPRTTQQPQIEQERAALEKLYESEFDVTLNDALNPTLKPITRGLPEGFPHANSFGGRFPPISSAAYTYQDSLFSSTDSKRAAIQSPAVHTRTSQSRHEQAYYDYDY